jgi:hypothetical protein
LALGIPVFLLLYREKINLFFLLKLGGPLVLAGSVLTVFFFPYMSLFKTFEFQRGLTRGASLINYLAVNPRNVIIGRFLKSLGRHEYYLSPGIAALILASYFIWRKRHLFRIKTKILSWIALAVVLVNAVIIVIIKCTGGFSLDLGLFSLSVHNPAKPAFTIFVVGLFFILVSFFKCVIKRKDEIPPVNRDMFFYTVLCVWSLLLSFGSSFIPLPFRWFYNHFPGFKGIRVPSRYAVFVIFATVVLAGYGIKIMSASLKKRKTRIWVGIVLVLFLNLEYLSLPKRMRFVPTGNDIPPAYQWLREKPRGTSIIELPFGHPIAKDAVYNYFSIFHQKRMVNGHSGFIPPAIIYIRKIFMAFPSWASLDILKTLGVDYVVLHKKMWKEPKAKRILQSIEQNFAEDLKLMREFRYSQEKPHYFSDQLGEDLIFQVMSSKSEERPKEKSIYQEIHHDCWKLSSNRRPDLLGHLVDNIMETRWTSARKKTTGDYLLVEFKEPMGVDRVSLLLGRFILDYALRIRVDVSSDGEKWHSYHGLFSPGAFVKSLVSSPLDLVQNIDLPGEKIKFLKIVEVGNDENFWWSAVELKIFKKKEKSGEGRG